MYSSWVRGSTMAKANIPVRWVTDESHCSYGAQHRLGVRMVGHETMSRGARALARSSALLYSSPLNTMQAPVRSERMGCSPPAMSTMEVAASRR